MATFIGHAPRWESTDLRVDVAGTTEPGWRCGHPLENGTGTCPATTFDPDTADGQHGCAIPTIGELAEWVEKVWGRQPSWRHGQTAFNVLHDVLPVCADLIRGGPYDPFHLDQRLPAFWTAVGGWLAVATARPVDTPAP